MDKEKIINDNVDFPDEESKDELCFENTDMKITEETEEVTADEVSGERDGDAITDLTPISEPDTNLFDNTEGRSLAFQDSNTFTDSASDDAAYGEEDKNIEEGAVVANIEESVVESRDNSEDDTVKTSSKQKRERTVGTRAIDTVFDFLELFIFTFVFVLLATSFIFRHSVVSGPSMMNTLQDGDKLIISDLFYEPEYRDIIVVQDYSVGMTDPIVKRVIATEGQKVKITHSGVIVDGAMLDESDYIFTDGLPYSHLARLDHTKFIHCPDYAFVPGSFCEFTVPEGELFVLGDHRNISQDSYFYGNVREDAVLGKVIVRIYPNFEFFN